VKWMNSKYQNTKGAVRLLSSSRKVSSLAQATKILASLSYIMKYEKI
jgi:hypothetical protein